MIKRFTKQKLWIVTFYNEESEKDWEIVVAPSFNMALKTAKKFMRDNYGLEKGERLNCSDFDAYKIDDECDLSGKIYQINLEIKKEK
jgi:hypothetical protein